MIQDKQAFVICGVAGSGKTFVVKNQPEGYGIQEITYDSSRHNIGHLVSNAQERFSRCLVTLVPANLIMMDMLCVRCVPFHFFFREDSITIDLLKFTKAGNVTPIRLEPGKFINDYLEFSLKYAHPPVYTKFTKA